MNGCHAATKCRVKLIHIVHINPSRLINLFAKQSFSPYSLALFALSPICLRIKFQFFFAKHVCVIKTSFRVKILKLIEMKKKLKLSEMVDGIKRFQCMHRNNVKVMMKMIMSISK